MNGVQFLNHYGKKKNYKQMEFYEIIVNYKD